LGKGLQNVVVIVSNRDLGIRDLLRCLDLFYLRDHWLFLDNRRVLVVKADYIVVLCVQNYSFFYGFKSFFFFFHMY